jgi:tRNA A37 threonylcarbamoyladenosine dehydratase
MLSEFSRSELILGVESTKVLAEKTAAIFGVGGVGSYAAEALARGGVGHFVIVDDDTVCLTNINRQAIALHSTIGRAKVEVMRERILDINPNADVAIRQCFYGTDNADQFDYPSFSYMVDCIDTVSAKILLAEKAKAFGVPLISSMGTGNKLDPLRLEFADISDTSVCPLARVMRRELKKRGIERLLVLYSREDPISPHDSENGGCASGCVCPPGSARNCAKRRQIPGSVSFVPPAAGIMIAGRVIKDLLGLS